MRERPAWYRGVLQLDAAVVRVENVVLIVSIALMVVLYFFYVLGRNISASLGEKWLAEIPLQMVLWVSVFGTSVAARRGRHINIDIAPRILSGLPLRAVRIITLLLSAFMAGVLSFAAFRYLITVEVAEGVVIQTIPITFGQTTLFSIPSWWFITLAPVGLGLACFHFLVGTLRELMDDPLEVEEEADAHLLQSASEVAAQVAADEAAPAAVATPAKEGESC